MEKNKNLILLLFGRVVSDIGSSIQMLIMPLYIIDIGGSAATIGLFSFLSLIPILLMYPLAGVIGDRLNRKMIMVIADFVSAVFVLLLAYISSIGRINIPLLLVIQIIVSFMYGLFDPATKGMIPQIVPKEELNKTNSKVATLRILSGLIAPLIAVELYTMYGITVLFLINGISFLVSASSEMLIKYKHYKRDSMGGVKGILTDMVEGAKFIKHSSIIKKLSIYFLVIFAFIHPIFSIVLPLYFRKELNYLDTQYGYLQVILFSGALLGSILVGRFRKDTDLRKPMFIGIVSMVVTMIIFACIIMPSIVIYLGNNSLRYFILFSSVLFFLYTSIMFINIPVQTFIQKVTPNKYMSRVFSIVGIISKGGMPLGALVYGIVLDKIDIYVTVLIVAIIIMIISMGFIVSFSRERNLYEMENKKEEKK